MWYCQLAGSQIAPGCTGLHAVHTQLKRSCPHLATGRYVNSLVRQFTLATEPGSAPTHASGVQAAAALMHASGTPAAALGLAGGYACGPLFATLTGGAGILAGPGTVRRLPQPRPGSSGVTCGLKSQVTGRLPHSRASRRLEPAPRRLEHVKHHVGGGHLLQGAPLLLDLVRVHHQIGLHVGALHLRGRGKVEGVCVCVCGGEVGMQRRGGGQRGRSGNG